MKMIKCDGKAGMSFLKILKLPTKCDFCGDEITEKNFGGVFGKQVTCDNICCLIEVDLDK